MRAEKGKAPGTDLAVLERRGFSNNDVEPFARLHHDPQCTRLIRAELVGSDRASAAGIAARGNSPVLQLCRGLVATGIDPDRPLHAYRGNVVCLIVRSIGAGAALTVTERRFGPAFERWKPFSTPPVRPPIASKSMAGVPPIRTAGAAR